MSNDVTTRRWNEENQARVSKWFRVAVLVTLLGGAIYCLFNLIASSRASKTLVVSISLGEYSGDLPQPAFPHWDGTDSLGITVERMTKENTGDQILKSFQSLSNSSEIHLTRKDTLVIYIRWHALVYQDEAYLLAGNFEREDVLSRPKSLPGDKAVPLRKIFRELNNVDVGNILLIADICELPTAPQFGVIANNVSEAAGRSLEEFVDGTPIWLITATAGLQHSHVSLKKRRTLLQSAIEYAVDPKRQKKDQEYLTLVDLYERVLRYADHVTRDDPDDEGAAQTPLLFCSGSSENISHTNQKRWQSAAAVRLRLLARTTDQEDENAEGAKDLKPESSSVAEAESSEAKSREADNTELLKEESSPWLQFWQLRTGLRCRKNFAGHWSPVDFDVANCLRLETEATKLEWQNRIAGSEAEKSNKLKALQDIIDDCIALDHAMRPEAALSGTRNLAPGTLSKAWEDFQRELQGARKRQPWDDPTKLEPKAAEDWEPIRDEYRIYIDAMSELPGWLRQGLQECQHDAAVLDEVEKLVTALADVDSGLPVEERGDAALDKPLSREGIVAVQEAIKNLHKHSSDQIDKLVERFKSAKKRETRISWIDEFLFQQYLKRTNADYSSRKMFVEAFDALGSDDVEEPGAPNIVLNRDRSIDDILRQADGLEPLDSYRPWCKMLRTSLQLASEPLETNGNERGHDIGDVDASSLSDLNRWGWEELLPYWKSHAKPPVPSVLRWKHACLAGLFDDAPSLHVPKFCWGPLVPVSNDDRLWFRSRATEYFLASGQPIRFEVGRNNNQTISTCYITWKPANGTSQPDSDGAQRVTLSLRRGSSGARNVRNGLVAGEIYPATLVRDGLEISVQASSSKQPEDNRVLKLSFALSDKERDLINPSASMWRDVSIIFPGPDRVDLMAEVADPLPGEKSLIVSEKTPFGGRLDALHVPAVGPLAQSRYKLFLSNRSDNELRVKASIYGPVDPQDIGAGSQADLEQKLTLSKQLLETGLLFESELVELLPTGPSNSMANRKQLRFVIPEAPPKTEGTVDKKFGEFGLLCVLREYKRSGQAPLATATEAETAVEPAKPKEQPTGKEFYYWIECIPENPYGSLVDIDATQEDGQFILDARVPDSGWSRWQIEELPLNVSLLSRENGDEIEDREIRGEITLSPPPKTSTARLKIRPKPTKDDTVNMVIVHLDIGNYPRAINFESRLRGGENPLPPRGSPLPFLWLGEVTCNNGQEQVPTIDFEKTLKVVPARIRGENTEELGDKVQVSKIVLPFRIDVPDKSYVASVEVNPPFLSPPKIYRMNRRFVPYFDLDGDQLVFSASATDLAYETELEPARMPEGKVEFRVAIENLDERKKLIEHKATLIFDRTAPIAADVVANARSIDTASQVTASITALDADTAVEKVVFGLARKTGRDTPTFADKEDDLTLPEPVDCGSNRWEVVIDGSKFEELKGYYYVVCRAVDIAGNVQDSNSPVRIDFLGKKGI